MKWEKPVHQSGFIGQESVKSEKPVHQSGLYWTGNCENGKTCPSK
ncbi:hypothetical protein V7127_07080 [Bacillus sp. JJ1773]